jgi:hypothetical protein
MRVKEQLELEKKATARMLEKQNKAIERFTESESSLNIQIVRARTCALFVINIKAGEPNQRNGSAGVNNRQLP